MKIESEHSPVILITGASKGIGRYLVDYYLERSFRVVGCSRATSTHPSPHYRHYSLDVADEKPVCEMMKSIRQDFGRLDILINNAGIASMNHSLLTPMETVERIFRTNVNGTFLLSREAAKIMARDRFGRIINFASVATPLKLEGEAIYAASKAAIISLTQILARELASSNITVNTVGPTPVRTDLIRSVPEEKLRDLLRRQAIHRFGEFRDISNVVDFFLKPESDFITGQVIYLGGV